MMEEWNDGMLGKTKHKKDLVVFIDFFHFSILSGFHYSSIPFFHSSNIPFSRRFSVF
jgi:hypothetical protein